MKEDSDLEKKKVFVYLLGQLEIFHQVLFTLGQLEYSLQEESILHTYSIHTSCKWLWAIWRGQKRKNKWACCSLFAVFVYFLKFKPAPLSPLAVLSLLGLEVASLPIGHRKSHSTACCHAAWRPGPSLWKPALQSWRRKGLRMLLRWPVSLQLKRREEEVQLSLAGSHYENWWSAAGTG